MSSFLKDIRQSFGNAGALYNLILIQAGIYLLLMAAKLVLFFTGIPDLFVQEFAYKLSLPAEPGVIWQQPWAFITYMFIHLDFFHIFFNLMILFWTGRIFSEFLGNKRILPVFLMGGFAGGLVYVLAFNLIPVLGTTLNQARLLGASAGVISILVAIATLIPDYAVGLLFFGQVRLRYIAVISIILYAISIPDGNAGGNIAHLGGALFGFMYIKVLRRGRDLSGWWNSLQPARKKNLKVEYSRSKTASDEAYRHDQHSQQQVIDEILDKISQSGYNSLTKEERDILFKVSQKPK